MKTCLICKLEFEATGSGKHKYCSEECRQIGYANYREANRAKIKSQKCSSQDSIEGRDFVTCLICGERGQRLYGKHFNEKHNGLKKSDYQKMFPGAQVACEKDHAKLNESRGKWMREPNHRERMSNFFKGSANPMSKENASELKRKQSSLFSLEYWKKRFPENTLAELTEMRSKWVKTALSDRVVATSIQYYINMGFDADSAKKLLSDRQTTFSLIKCIEKYGEEEGLKKWKDRQNSWKSKVFNQFTHIGRGTSKISEQFINSIISKIPEELSLLHGGNEQFIYDTEYKRVYKYDFCELTNKKIIEFNGDFWHCNPKLFDPTYYHKIKKMTAADIWNYDYRKIELAKSHGYKLLTVWEYDYRANPDETVDLCLKFILSN